MNVSKRSWALAAAVSLGLAGLVGRATALDPKDKEFPQVPKGFEIKMLAQPPQVEYPVGVCTTPAGDEVFVGQDPENVRGRTNGLSSVVKVTFGPDGKAIVTPFVDKVNGPRGMCFVDGTLYVVHGPTIAAYKDTPSGPNTEHDTLVTGFGFEPKELQQDHACAGIRMAIDGWLYMAVGDQGFVKATAKDGSTLQMHQGGIVRVRPDGTEMEQVTWRQRNIYNVDIDPLLNIFTRDNTNDGDGWDTHFNYDVMGADYGYPYLWIRYSDEIAEKIADYGGGSGTGGYYTDEAAWPKPYGDMLYSCDWGRGKVFMHEKEPNGASFKVKQEDFLKGSRPIGIDMDGVGRMVYADWRGGVFGRMKNPVGYIARVSVAGPAPAAFPDLDKASDAELVQFMTHDSAVLRINAQHAILRRGDKPEIAAGLEKIIGGNGSLYTRVAALFTLKQLEGAASNPKIAKYLGTPDLKEFALRALCDRKKELATVDPQLIVDALKDANPRVRVQAVNGISRLGKIELASNLIPVMNDADPIVRHLAMRALRTLNAVDACLAVVDTSSPMDAENALRTMRDMHSAPAVDGLIAKLKSAADPALRASILSTLGRLYFTEGEWDGKWWGTRPDQTGPYFKTAEWEQTPKIAQVLEESVKNPQDTNALVGIIAKFRVPIPGSAPLIVKVAQAAGPAQLDAIRALTQLKDAAGPEAAAALENVAMNKSLDARIRSDALAAIGRMSGKDATAILARLIVTLDGTKSATPEVLTAAVKAMGEANKDPGALLKLLDGASPELQQIVYAPLLKSADKRVKDVIAKAWTDDAKALMLIQAIARGKVGEQAGKLGALMTDKRPAIRQAAIAAAGKLESNALVDKLITVASQKESTGAALKSINQIAAWRVSDPKIVGVAEHLGALAAALPPGDPNLNDALRTARAFSSDSRIDEAKREELLAAIAKISTPGGTGNTIADIGYDDAYKRVQSMTGDKALGEKLFTQQGCINCHTRTKAETPKGPFLGEVGTTYQRPYLSESVLFPSKVIAFGFDTHWYKLKTNDTIEGFVSHETSEEVDVRNAAGQVTTVHKADIKTQGTRKESIMPQGLADNLSMQDFASLMAYLESLKGAAK